MRILYPTNKTIIVQFTRIHGIINWSRQKTIYPRKGIKKPRASPKTNTIDSIRPYLIFLIERRKSSIAKYGKKAQEEVHKEMKAYKKGEAHSGKGKKK